MCRLQHAIYILPCRTDIGYDPPICVCASCNVSQRKWRAHMFDQAQFNTHYCMLFCFFKLGHMWYWNLTVHPGCGICQQQKVLEKTHCNGKTKYNAKNECELVYNRHNQITHKISPSIAVKPTSPYTYYLHTNIKLKTWPGMTTNAVRRYSLQYQVTSKGHLHRPRTGIW